jgi:hypothetical protein
MAASVIEVDEKLAATLRSQAEARQLSLETFLQRIAQTSVSLTPAIPLAENEWNRAIDEASGDFPVLPAGFSRADIYSDHD